IGPSQPLERLHQRILEADPALEPPLPSAPPNHPAPRPPRRAPPYPVSSPRRRPPSPAARGSCCG
ncbi:hypothetical protein AB4212_54545, partial [Streptomyces sp. 2MCAF27]